MIYQLLNHKLQEGFISPENWI